MLSPNLTAETRRPFSDSLESVSLRVERFAPYIAGAILVLTYLVATVKSFYKPLWYDEILTTLIARLPTLHDILSCTKQVPDGQPIFYYWIVRASIWLFGSDPWGLRVPSTIGYLLFCLSLYWFVSRQTSRLYGLLALLFPNITGCWYYATEGRPYGLVMAGTGMAALSWQSVAMNRSRKLALTGLSLSLLFAFSVHYFATLLFIPFATAELIRTVERRKLDIPVWVAFALPFSILGFYLPIMHETHKNAGTGTPFTVRPGWFRSPAIFAEDFIGPALVVLICVACLYAAYTYFVQLSEPKREYRSSPGYLLPYVALALPLVCILPFAGIAAGKFVTHQFFSRYVIGSMFGMIATATLIIWFAFRQSRTAALIVSLIFAAFFCHTIVWDMREAASTRSNPPEVSVPNRIPVQVRSDDRPIVFADVLQFLDFHYYGDPALRRKMYYVSSDEFALRVFGFTIAERTIEQSAPFFGTQVIDYHRWVREHPAFYVFGGPDWIVPQLLDERANLQLLKAGEDTLYRVTLADSGPGSRAAQTRSGN